MSCKHCKAERKKATAGLALHHHIGNASSTWCVNKGRMGDVAFACINFRRRPTVDAIRWNGLSRSKANGSSIRRGMKWRNIVIQFFPSVSRLSSACRLFYLDRAMSSILRIILTVSLASSMALVLTSSGCMTPSPVAFLSSPPMTPTPPRLMLTPTFVSPLA